MSNDGCEHHAFDQSGDHVAQVDRIEHIVDIQQWRQASAKEHEQAAGQNAEQIRDDAEAGD